MSACTTTPPPSAASAKPAPPRRCTPCKPASPTPASSSKVPATWPPVAVLRCSPPTAPRPSAPPCKPARWACRAACICPVWRGTTRCACAVASSTSSKISTISRRPFLTRGAKPPTSASTGWPWAVLITTCRWLSRTGSWGVCSTCSVCAPSPLPMWRGAAAPSPPAAPTRISRTWASMAWRCSTFFTCARPSRRGCGWCTAAAPSKCCCKRLPSACASKPAFFAAQNPLSMPTSDQAPAVPRLTYLRIKNYRALRDVEFRDLTPLTVLIGPNGSGKSTVLDALDFLAEAVRGNLVAAWEKRERFRGMRTQGSEELVEFETELFIDDTKPRLLYKLVIDEADGVVFVSDESLVEIINGEKQGRIFYLNDAEPNQLRDQGYESDFRINIYSHDLTQEYSTSPSSVPFVARAGFFPEQIGSQWSSALAIVKFFSSYRKVALTDKHLSGFSDKGPRESLSANGDNLTNVLYYYYLKHPKILKLITEQLRQRVPMLTEVLTEMTSDERLLLRFRDATFEKPFPARFMSGGTLKFTALFALLYEPSAEGILAIEEPENELHPQLIQQLTEEFIKATEKRQLFVATHSPALLNALEPAQIWIMHRASDGYTHATCLADLSSISELVEEGSPPGYLWTRNFFDVGNPSSPPQPIAR
ncbi:MAG: hypothetical protein EOO56_02665 [Hymenobacter sp.]|nr:MAG: hypothetical protein EOO56_02665 [Hymenobacter sp.]